MKKISICLMVLLLSGCLNQSIESTLIKGNENDSTLEILATVDDIENWDIDINDVESVELYVFFEDKKEWEFLTLTDTEVTRFIHAFNTIQKNDIYWDISSPTPLYNLTASSVSIDVNKKNGEKILLTYDPLNIIGYNENVYFTRYYLELGDVIRELQTKYGFRYVDLEYNINIPDNKVLTAWYEDALISPALTVNDLRETLNKDRLNGLDMTFNDIIESYKSEIELNDMIETEDMRIKIIEIKNNKVTAITVSFK